LDRSPSARSTCTASSATAMAARSRNRSVTHRPTRYGRKIRHGCGANVAHRGHGIRGYKHFANKLWNITRFVLENYDVEKYGPGTATFPDDENLLDEMKNVADEVAAHVNTFRLDLEADKIYHFMWDRFAAEIRRRVSLRCAVPSSSTTRTSMPSHLLAGSLSGQSASHRLSLLTSSRTRFLAAILIRCLMR